MRRKFDTVDGTKSLAEAGISSGETLTLQVAKAPLALSPAPASTAASSASSAGNAATSSGGGTAGMATSWLHKGAYVSYVKTGEVVEVVSIEAPMPGDADVFVTVRLPDGVTRESSGSHLAPMPGSDGVEDLAPASTTTSTTAPPPTQMARDDPPPQQVSAQAAGPHMMQRTVPADNSCLFTSAGYLLQEKDLGLGQQLRELVASVIEADPVTYNATVLDNEPAKYCEWLRQASSWGGAIELKVIYHPLSFQMVPIDRGVRCVVHPAPQGAGQHHKGLGSTTRAGQRAKHDAYPEV